MIMLTMSILDEGRDGLHGLTFRNRDGRCANGLWSGLRGCLGIGFFTGWRTIRDVPCSAERLVSPSSPEASSGMTLLGPWPPGGGFEETTSGAVSESESESESGPGADEMSSCSSFAIIDGGTGWVIELAADASV